MTSMLKAITDCERGLKLFLGGSFQTRANAGIVVLAVSLGCVPVAHPYIQQISQQGRLFSVSKEAETISLQGCYLVLFMDPAIPC